MSSRSPMTVRVRLDVKQKLSEIADVTQRSRSSLAGEAIAAYVEHELEIIDGIKRGLADADAGRVVSHDDATAEIYAVIERAEAKRTGKR